MSHQGKSILVTGASSGIGLAITAELVKRQYQVFACARKEEDLKRLQDEVGAIPVELDVTNEQQIKNLETVLSQKLGSSSLFGLINNAGIAQHGPVECVPMSVLRKQLEVNFFGLYSVTQTLLPFIREARGRIINISSISGRIASPFLSPYCASKFAVEAMTDSLRRELDSLGVKVVSVLPGFIKTPILEKQPDKKELEELFFTREGQKEAYFEKLEKLGKHVDEEKKKAGPVEIVVTAVMDGLESPKPKTRYYVGKGISFAAKLCSILPDKWLDWIISKRI
jgi:NAD(P)-dependent dehydrogenase (short-subunit alcohol dehydrogenase family)